MYKYLLLFLLACSLSVPAFAQNEADTVEIEDEWDDWDEWEDNDEDHDFDWDKDFRFEIDGAPTIAVNYGLSKLNHNDVNGTFAEPRSFELKIGYTDMDKVWQSDYILQTDFKYLSVSNINTDLASLDEGTTDYKSNTWRIGFGKNSGYGYEFGNSALYLTNGSSMDWTRFRFNNLSSDSLDRNIAGLYNNTFRFGNSFEAGIRFQIIKQISLEADYERAVVFPRHLFWKWLGSAAIELTGQVLIDQFVNEILDSSPAFAPVIGFLLKNGLNYGMYELRKEKMNWPFNSTAPMQIDQFKFGLTFVL